MSASKAGFCEAQGPQLVLVKHSNSKTRSFCALTFSEKSISNDVTISMFFFMRVDLLWFFTTKVEIFQKMAMFLLQDWEKFCIFAD
jgi:putative hemolysin